MTNADASVAIQRSVFVGHAARAGHEPIGDMHVMADHDRAYDVWKACGVRDRILVHFDGHLDFDWITDGSAEELLAARSSEELDRLLARVSAWNLDGQPLRARVNITNFLYPAVKEGIVREFFWVIPDPFWATRARRRVIRRGLERKILRRRPADVGPMEVSETAITLTVAGRPLVVCPLEHLPSFSEPVLLDIDVDYFVTREPSGPAPYYQRQPVTPWIWPSAFLRRLTAARLPTDLVTIAYSVNGGYTPVQYRYFGDLLQEALRNPDRPMGDEPTGGSAAEAFREAIRALTHGDVAAAREWWGAMMRRDPAYRTVYATPGWREETHGRWRSALGIYDQMVQVDPDWHVPHLGRGRVLWQFRQYAQAEAAFETAASLSRGATSATHWLGVCALRRGDREAARRRWTQAVSQDPKEARSWYGLAQLEMRRGNLTGAIERARQCVELGFSAPPVHWLMARAARRSGRRRLFRREVKLWAGRALQAMAAGAVDRWRRLRVGAKEAGVWTFKSLSRSGRSSGPRSARKSSSWIEPWESFCGSTR